MSNAMRPTARKKGLFVRQIDTEILVYDLEVHQAHCLNEFTARVWRLCDGSRNMDEIRAELDHANDRERLADAICELESASLIESGTDPTLASNVASQAPVDLDRRNLSASLLAATAAGVLVTSVSVPTAAQAASCLSLFAPCSSNAECCSGICGGLCLP